MAQTKIEWTDATWNPVTGCSAISEGCVNCYARRMSNRLRGRCGYDAEDPFKVTLRHDRLDEPLKWRKPRRVFVCSMADLFHEDVPFGFIAEVFHTMMGECSGEAAPKHTYQILTKRPQRMLDFFAWLRNQRGHDEAGHLDEIPENSPSYIWLGVTAENQARADERIPLLLQTPAAVHFVSIEPMLGPVVLRSRLGDPTGPSVDWVICGAETGPGARPMAPQWAVSLRDQCSQAGTPFFFKKWSGKPPNLRHPMPREWPPCR